MENTETKVCSKCGVEKPISHFRFDKKRNSYRCRCRACRTISKREWLSSLSEDEKKEQGYKRRKRYSMKSECEKEIIRNRWRIGNLSEDEKQKRREKDRKRHIENKHKTMFYGARKRALDAGIEFDITIEDIVIPQVCPVLGIPIIHNISGNPSPNSPSLDRIDNTKGYVKGNVCVISYRANNIKGSGSIEEHLMIVQYMKKHITHQSPKEDMDIDCSE